MEAALPPNSRGSAPKKLMKQSYSDRELEAFLTDLGSDHVERIESFKNVKDKVCQAICAFANDLPNHKKLGLIFIGAKDDGSPSGLKISDELLLDIAHLRSAGRILPLPAMQVEKRHLKGS